MTKAAIHLWMAEKIKTQRAFVFEQKQDKARARGERIHLIWSQLPAHAYHNGQWGQGQVSPSPKLSSLPHPVSWRASPRRHEPGAGRSDGQA